jgi:hypothetical protein
MGSAWGRGRRPFCSGVGPLIVVVVVVVVVAVVPASY